MAERVKVNPRKVVAVKRKENSNGLDMEINKPVNESAGSGQNVVVVSMYTEERKHAYENKKTLTVLLYRLKEEQFFTMRYAGVCKKYTQALIKYYERKLYKDPLPSEVQWKKN